MDHLIDLAHWVAHKRPDLWLVIVLALLWAWVDQAGHGRRLGRYDAWWFHNNRRTVLKKRR